MPNEVSKRRSRPQRPRSMASAVNDKLADELDNDESNKCVKFLRVAGTLLIGALACGLVVLADSWGGGNADE